ncbi:solute carrier family 35 member G1 [Exaiptasia diaphana]|uniref:Solute carrier family 35 member G1 n=1 Tax=Exaiptasia diaphana TaxID=2652724 RepID=A0A913WU82_EXADI|nr:solute carrier family 35 member G1 [Exaiptasia diaphana]KXJ17776.1 Solute carrier family 35 member G1 [Exaiptasia diaphana]
MEDETSRRNISFNQILGPLLAALSCFFFAISSLFVKLLGEIPPQEVVFFRCLVQFVFLLPPLIYARVPIFGDVHHLPCLFIRALAGTFALCCQFYAFQHMPLADATVIVFSSPIFTGILAYFILGESWGLFNFLGTTLCFIGIILIARPTFMFPREVDPSFNGDWQQATASLVALTGAILTSIALISLRKLAAISYLVPVLYVAMAGVILTAAGVLVTGSFQSVLCGSSHQWLLLIIGLCGIAGQSLLTKSLQLEQAGIIALVRTLDIVFAFVLQLVFLDYQASVYSLIGAALIITCNVLVILNKWMSVSKPNGEQSIIASLRVKVNECKCFFLKGKRNN